MLSRLRPASGLVCTPLSSSTRTTSFLSSTSSKSLGKCSCAECQDTVRNLPNFNNTFSNNSHNVARRYFSCGSHNSDLVLLQKNPEKKTALLTLNRPKALNALNDSIITELLKKLTDLDNDPEVRCIVLTGSKKAFAAGADIKEMNTLSFAEVQKRDMLGFWNKIKEIKKPIIAAVNGYALGGGCELAMSCDIILASSSAEFGQPEVLLGTIPGCGGTQRLTQAVGKSKAMRWILNGDRFSAEEAERSGLVAKVIETDKDAEDSNDLFIQECLKEAEKIAKFSSPVLNVAKECVNQSLNLGLDDGLLFERRNFHATWALEDRKEGMSAFAEKRKATFKDC